MNSERSVNGALNRLDVSLDDDPAFLIEFGQEMGAFGQRVRSSHHYIVRRNLDVQRRRGAALGIFLTASHEFKALQGRLPYAVWSGGSSYSSEDLVSNLVGFYSAFLDVSIAELRKVCGEVSVQESYRIWDKHVPNGLGARKNRTTRPILYPTKEGGDTTFPRLLTSIQPTPEGRDWVRPRGGSIATRFIDMGARLTVSRAGVVSPTRPGTLAFPARTRRR